MHRFRLICLSAFSLVATACAAGDASWMRGSYGFSVHWTYQSAQLDGSSGPFADAVARFDAERFAETLKAADADHCIFTLAHGRQYLPCPNAALDAIAPGRTSSRDLVGDLIAALGKRGIRFIAYYNHSCNEWDEAEGMLWKRQVAYPCDLKGGDMATFGRNIAAIIGDLSRRYGKGISAWWFDSPYSVDSHGPGNAMSTKCEWTFPWAPLIAAARIGNPAAAVAINAGVGKNYQYAPGTDYFAGETVRLDQPFTEPAPGVRLQDTRWICADCTDWVWGARQARSGDGFHALRYPKDVLRAWAKQHLDAGRMVTFNLLVDRSGTVNPVIAELKKSDVLAAGPFVMPSTDDGNPQTAFENPPPRARNGVWWHWMGSQVTKEGIVRDLDWFKATGISSATVFGMADVCTPWATPIANPPGGKVVAFTPPWWALLKFACEEAEKRGIELGLHNCPGYTSTGGPWITPEKAMRELVFNVKDPAKDIPLAAHALFPVWNPATEKFQVPEMPCRRTDLRDIATVKGVRVSHIPMGAFVQPAQDEAFGLECDKMDPEAISFHLDHVIGELKKHLGEQVGRGLKFVLLDSYEAGKPTWTKNMREEFRKRRGYDPLPLLPVLGGFDVTDAKTAAKFKADYDRTIADLYRDVLYRIMHEKLAAAGLEFACEPYGGPFVSRECAAYVDRVMDEFWFDPDKAKIARPQKAQGWTRWARLDGSPHRVIEAEAFTGQPGNCRWSETPAMLKRCGDVHYVRGINRFTLHTCPLQPWDETVLPGLSMGRWGTHFGRTQTWAKDGKAWFDYTARCQALLQWGRPSSWTPKLEGGESVGVISREGYTTTGGISIHFHCNHADRETVCSFKVVERVPEWFDPLTGRIVTLAEKDGRVFLRLAPYGSGFLVFRKNRKIEDPVTPSPLAPLYQPQTETAAVALDGAWQVEFPDATRPAEASYRTTFAALHDWTADAAEEVKYFSGTAVYRKTFDFAGDAARTFVLSLGACNEQVAAVRVNGVDLGVAWCAPYELAIPAGVLKSRGNVCEIRFTNVWANRLIGDARLAEDCPFAKAPYPGGRYLTAFPDWFAKGAPRPTKRRTFVTFDYFTKDSPLVPSGLLGPVRLTGVDDGAGGATGGARGGLQPTFPIYAIRDLARDLRAALHVRGGTIETHQSACIPVVE